MVMRILLIISIFEFNLCVKIQSSNFVFLNKNEKSHKQSFEAEVRSRKISKVGYIQEGIWNFRLSRGF